MKKTNWTIATMFGVWGMGVSFSTLVILTSEFDSAINETINSFTTYYNNFPIFSKIVSNGDDYISKERFVSSLKFEKIATFGTTWPTLDPNTKNVQKEIHPSFFSNGNKIELTNLKGGTPFNPSNLIFKGYGLPIRNKIYNAFNKLKSTSWMPLKIRLASEIESSNAYFAIDEDNKLFRIEHISRNAEIENYNFDWKSDNTKIDANNKAHAIVTIDANHVAVATSHEILIYKYNNSLTKQNEKFTLIKKINNLEIENISSGILSKDGLVFISSESNKIAFIKFHNLNIIPTFQTHMISVSDDSHLKYILDIKYDPDIGEFNWIGSSEANSGYMFGNFSLQDGNLKSNNSINIHDIKNANTFDINYDQDYLLIGGSDTENNQVGKVIITDLKNSAVLSGISNMDKITCIFHLENEKFIIADKSGNIRLISVNYNNHTATTILEKRGFIAGPIKNISWNNAGLFLINSNDKSIFLEGLYYNGIIFKSYYNNVELSTLLGSPFLIDNRYERYKNAIYALMAPKSSLECYKLYDPGVTRYEYAENMQEENRYDLYYCKVDNNNYLMDDHYSRFILKVKFKNYGLNKPGSPNKPELDFKLLEIRL